MKRQGDDQGPPACEIAILGYHKIGPQPPGGWESWYYIPEDVFESQLERLRELGYDWIDAATFVEALSDPERLPARSALLTFDDGIRSMRSVALPILQRFEAPSVLFVPTDFIGGRNEFDAGVEPDEAMCGWEDLLALEAGGVSIQSHSASHRPFSTLTLAEKAAELRRSKDALEDGLGRPVELFAFPYGDDGRAPTGDAAVRGEQQDLADIFLRTGYRAACLYGGGPQRLPTEHPFRLTRLAIGPDSDLEALLCE